ncbi:PilZ domain-containing protein [Faunimonas pinastri]|uniref:PilZ domain-containing protein n=1 Tax=Faunimonas pinastri TaxID=1855383 RepID=A0A1H9DAS6_9HYPH|nr:PilZ domain-containing protein [Faunimonas pinastri]SEQ10590.1 PilZ domain-containing protein [Faunimonas pinastri]
MSALPDLQIEVESNSERRSHQRVKISLLGRCMFADRQEFPCTVIDVSPGGAAFYSPHQGEVGERIVAYVDHIGRVEGTIVRQIESGFAIAFTASRIKRDKLADTLTWLANRHLLETPEERRQPRRVPRKTDAVLTLSDGTTHSCRIIDMSLTGAALATDLRPPRGAKIMIGKVGGRVVRHFDDGIAIEFMRAMSEGNAETEIPKEFF